MHKNSFNQIMKRYYEDKRLGIKNEDAPTNSVGTGALVALPPTHEPGIDPKKKSISIIRKPKTTVFGFAKYYLLKTNKIGWKFPGVSKLDKKYLSSGVRNLIQTLKILYCRTLFINIS